MIVSENFPPPGLSFFTSDFDYHLPEDRIPAFPLDEREGSRLLISGTEGIAETRFSALPQQIPPNSLLCFNDTKVIRARLLFKRPAGGHIELFCLEPAGELLVARALDLREEAIWTCLVGNARKWKSGELEMKLNHGPDPLSLYASLLERSEGVATIRFRWSQPAFCFAEILEMAGRIPLPPYLKRDSEPIDDQRYQTVYGIEKGSVAAPTAGLHFTKELLGQMEGLGIGLARITLHVGAGTFRPVKTDRITDHDMHGERFFAGRTALEALRSCSGPRLAVGTTSLRALESLYWIGEKIRKYPYLHPDELSLGQWEPYSMAGDMNLKDSLDTILRFLDRHQLERIHAKTNLMIVPGYRFRVFDALITNFHQPRSTLLMLVHAFAGPRAEEIYQYALNNGFRFLSYGDASLIWKAE